MTCITKAKLQVAVGRHLCAMALCMRVPAFNAMLKKRKLRNRLMSSTLPLRMAYVYSHLPAQNPTDAASRYDNVSASWESTCDNRCNSA